MKFRSIVVLMAVAALTVTLGLLVANPHVLAGTPLLKLVPEPQGTDGLLRVEIRATSAGALAGWEADLGYDTDQLELVSIEAVPGFGRIEGCDSGDRCVLLLGPKPVLGGSSIGALSWGEGPALRGDGPLAVLTFRPRANEGSVTLRLDNPLVTNGQGQAVVPQTEGVTVDLGHTPNHSLFLPAVTNE